MGRGPISRDSLTHVIAFITELSTVTQYKPLPTNGFLGKPHKTQRERERETCSLHPQIVLGSRHWCEKSLHIEDTCVSHTDRCGTGVNQLLATPGHLDPGGSKLCVMMSLHLFIRTVKERMLTLDIAGIFWPGHRCSLGRTSLGSRRPGILQALTWT